MLFFYTRYEYILTKKVLTATLKGNEEVDTFDLYIVTPATKFLGLPIGGGLVKMSRLYTKDDQLVHARHYSPELKQEVKELKKTVKIPYFKLWKGYLIMLSVAVIGSLLYGIKMKRDAAKYNGEIEDMITAIHNLKVGQLYGVSFFTDDEGNNINGLPSGWIRIEKIEGDTVFIRRSSRILTDKALFTMADIAAIKPASEDDWNSKVEKMNYALLKEDLEAEGKKRFDLLYIGADYEKYPGVIMTIKGTE